jgi:hypothetical protein
VAAQALKGHRVVPAIGTIDRASGRVMAVLFRVVPLAANHARYIWNTITTVYIGRAMTQLLVAPHDLT